MRRSERRQLPPGPSVPKAVQMLATWTRPAASLERLRRYGKRITVQLPFQPPFVMLWDAADIKQVFAAPPDVLHPGEGASILEPLIGRNSVILLVSAAMLPIPSCTCLHSSRSPGWLSGSASVRIVLPISS